MAELMELGHDVERELLDFVLTEGYVQGCFVRPENEDLVYGFPGLADAIDALRSRPPCEPEADDPFEQSSLVATPIDGDGPGWVILNQRCDLIRGVGDEPFVDLAAVSYCTDSAQIAAARVNSPRWILLADEGDGAWIADLRVRAQLPKHRLPKVGPAVLPVPERARAQFALRIGRRYSRDAVPTDIVEEVQKPLVEQLKKGNRRRRQTESFSEFLAVRRDGELLVLGVIGSEADPVEAARVFGEIVDRLRTKAGLAIHRKSGAFTTVDLPLSLWLDSHKLDLDQLTWSSRASEEAAEPNR